MAGVGSGGSWYEPRDETTLLEPWQKNALQEVYEVTVENLRPESITDRMISDLVLNLNGNEQILDARMFSQTERCKALMKYVMNGNVKCLKSFERALLNPDYCYTHVGHLLRKTLASHKERAENARRSPQCVPVPSAAATAASSTASSAMMSSSTAMTSSAYMRLGCTGMVNQEFPPPPLLASRCGVRAVEEQDMSYPVQAEDDVDDELDNCGHGNGYAGTPAAAPRQQPVCSHGNGDGFPSQNNIAVGSERRLGDNSAVAGAVGEAANCVVEPALDAIVSMDCVRGIMLKFGEWRAVALLLKLTQADVDSIAYKKEAELSVEVHQFLEHWLNAQHETATYKALLDAMQAANKPAELLRTVEGFATAETWKE